MTKTEPITPPSAALFASHQVQVADEAQRIGVPTAGAGAPASVALIRNGDAIVGVEIVCSCGQRIRLAFDGARA